MRPLTRRLITAFDTFALLIPGDDHAQANHILIGKAGDMVAMTDVLDTVHYESHRPCAVSVLASRSRNGATYPIPCVRLTKAKRRALVDAITDFGQSTPKTTKTCKFADPLASSVCVY